MKTNLENRYFYEFETKSGDFACYYKKDVEEWFECFKKELREIVACDSLNLFEKGYRALAEEILGESK